LSVVNCKHCHKDFNVPPSKVWRSNFCSDPCRQKAKEIVDVVKKTERTRFCLHCNKKFVPRLYQLKNNIGKYCSIICRNKAILPNLLSENAKQKARATYKKNLELGLIKHPTGENHPRWLGGEQVHRQKRIKSGKSKETLRLYRKNNPDKVREWADKRLNKKINKLPRGTIKNLISKQNGLCVYCSTNVISKYHVDHIVPLAKDGKHEPSNLQILCPSCNVKKWTKSDAEFRDTINKRKATNTETNKSLFFSNATQADTSSTLTKVARIEMWEQAHRATIGELFERGLVVVKSQL